MIKYVLNRIHQWQLNKAIQRLQRLGLIEVSDNTIGLTPIGRTAGMYLRRFKNMESK